jgi:hypothetical protein
MSACLLAAGAVTAALPLLPGTTTALLFCSRLGVMAAFTVLYVCSAEVYPTCVWSLGLGLRKSCSRLGGFAAPLVAVWLLQRSGAAAAKAWLARTCAVAAVAAAALRRETDC